MQKPTSQTTVDCVQNCIFVCGAGRTTYQLDLLFLSDNNKPMSAKNIQPPDRWRGLNQPSIQKTNVSCACCLKTNLHRGFPGPGWHQIWPWRHHACRLSPLHKAAWTDSPKIMIRKETCYCTILSCGSDTNNISEMRDETNLTWQILTVCVCSPLHFQ